MNLTDFLLHSDLVSRVLTVALLALSVSSWVVIVWKWRLLARVSLDVRRSVAAFWQAPGFDAAQQRVAQFDRDACVLPLLEATLLPLGGTLAAAGEREHQLTRVLRDSMQATVRRLQWGQLMLATAGLANAYAAKGIRVNAINPGLTRTGRLEEGMAADARLQGIETAEAMQRAVAKIPMGRMAEPEEIARVVLFLASEAASYVTGVNMSMDGSMTPLIV